MLVCTLALVKDGAFIVRAVNKGVGSDNRSIDFTVGYILAHKINQNIEKSTDVFLFENIQFVVVFHLQVEVVLIHYLVIVALQIERCLQISHDLLEVEGFILGLLLFRLFWFLFALVLVNLMNRTVYTSILNFLPQSLTWNHLYLFLLKKCNKIVAFDVKWAVVL